MGIQEGLVMTERYVIEVGGQHYGLLVKEGRGFVFHATDAAVAHLDQAEFASPRAATNAVRQVLDAKAA